MGNVETYCFLRYWNNYKSKFIKILNYIFMINWLKYSTQKLDSLCAYNVSIPSGKNMFQGLKFFNPLILYTAYSIFICLIINCFFLTYVFNILDIQRLPCQEIEPFLKFTQHKIWSFPWQIFSVNVNKSTGNCGFGHIYWSNL